MLPQGLVSGNTTLALLSKVVGGLQQLTGDAVVSPEGAVAALAAIQNCHAPASGSRLPSLPADKPSSASVVKTEQLPQQQSQPAVKRARTEAVEPAPY